jgi:hypothetical protein
LVTVSPTPAAGSPEARVIVPWKLPDLDQSVIVKLPLQLMQPCASWVQLGPPTRGDWK